MLIPGEIRARPGELELNAGRRTETVRVVNTGDRPVQLGSHAHFFEVNRALRFDREKAYGMRLDIPSGTAVRFERGEEKPVTLVSFGGRREAHGMNGIARGRTRPGEPLPPDVRERLASWLGGKNE